MPFKKIDGEGSDHKCIQLYWLVVFYGISTVVGYLMPNLVSYIYIYIKKQDLALNNPQELICHKIQPSFIYKSLYIYI